MSAQELKSLRVLVFDPDKERAGFIREILENTGVGQIFAISSSEIAISRLREAEITLTLVELGDMAPNSISAVFLETLRDPSRSPAPGMPVLGVMSKVTKISLQKAVHVGADFVIQRPFSAKDLSARIVSMLAAPAPQFNAPDYVGPDRRRMPDNLYDGSLRRRDDT